jgi:hypothetical protein
LTEGQRYQIAALKKAGNLNKDISLGSKTLSDENRWFQPPDAENRMYGGVGGITGVILLSPPDQSCQLFRISAFNKSPQIKITRQSHPALPKLSALLQTKSH